MKVISVINYKGGVGKTTLTANIASELVERGKRVLVMDLDPQSNLTFSYLKVDEWKQFYEVDKNIKFWFDSIIDGVRSVPSFKQLIVNKNVDIICSHLGLIDVDIELATGLSSKTDRQYKKNFIKTFSYIRNELDVLKEDYDLVLIDCPPNFSIVTKNALIASDYYIVPAKLDYLSTLGINHLRNHVFNLVKDFNSYCDKEMVKKAEPKFLGVIASMVSFRNNELITAQNYYLNELKRIGIPIFESMMRENKTIYASAPEEGVPVVLHSYNNRTYLEIKSELKNLATEFIRKVGIV